MNPEEENRQLRQQLKWLFMGEVELPPLPSLEAENQLLRQVLALADGQAGNKTVSVLEYLDYPPVKNLDDIPPEMIDSELNALLDLMEKGAIYLHICGDYPPETIYRFITGTLLFEEVSAVKITGMQNFFRYEDYHPNSQVELRALACFLVRTWYWGTHTSFDDHLSAVLITPMNTVFDRRTVLGKIRSYIGTTGIVTRRQGFPQRGSVAFDTLKDQQLEIQVAEIRMNDEQENSQTGIVTGRSAVFQPGAEPGHWENFIFHCKKLPGEQEWSVYYFELPGFAWE